MTEAQKPFELKDGIQYFSSAHAMFSQRPGTSKWNEIVELDRDEILAVNF